MASNFFDGTLDDFFLDDSAFFALASLALPLNSQSPPRSLRISPVRSVPHESSAAGARFGAGRGFGEGSASASALPLLSDLGAALDLRPTRAGPSNNVNPRPPAAYRRPELSRLNASSRNGGIPNLPNNFPLPPGFLPLQAPAHPTISPALSPSRVTSTLPINHGLSTPASPSSLPRGQSRGGNLNSSHDSLVHTRHRGPNQDHTGNVAGIPNFTAAASTRPPAMSSSTRRRSARPPGVLTLPAPPSQPRSSNPRPTARSSSRPLQPEPSSSTQKRKRDDLASDDLFGDAFAGHEVVDLVDTDEVPANMLLSQEKNKNQVRLRSFDCVICMDNAKEMTVTHCGHLFCSECLGSALSIGQAKRICPICRQKIDKLPNSGKFGKNGKGFYSLELKLTTKRSLRMKAERPSQGAA